MLRQNASLIFKALMPGWEVDREDDSAMEQLLDTVMLRLRLADGLDLVDVAQNFGVEAAQAVARSLQRHMSTGLVKQLSGSANTAHPLQAGVNLLDMPSMSSKLYQACEATLVSERPHLEQRQDLICSSQHTYRLSDPEGFLVSNDIISDVFSALLPQSSRVGQRFR